MNAQSRVNPLLSSVIHRPFRQACRELGLSTPHRDQFVAEIDPLLKDTPLNVPDVDGLAERFWRAVLSGEVLAAEWLEDGRMVFHVRGQHGRDGVDLRLIHDRDQWHVLAITSLHRRPWLSTRMARRGGAPAMVLAALLVGYLLPHPSHSATPGATDTAVTSASAVAAANNGGGTLASRSGEPANTQQDAGTGGAEAGSGKSPTKPASSPTPVVFQLQQGMPIHNLSVFLYQHHLVKDPVAFDMKMKDSGVDRKLRPGTYRFMSNMTEDQVLKVLAKGPSS